MQTGCGAPARCAASADAQITAELVVGPVQSSSAPISVAPKHSGMIICQEACRRGRPHHQELLRGKQRCGPAPCRSDNERAPFPQKGGRKRRVHVSRAASFLHRSSARYQQQICSTALPRRGIKVDDMKQRSRWRKKINVLSRVFIKGLPVLRS